jgi:hypothetical protein
MRQKSFGKSVTAIATSPSGIKSGLDGDEFSPTKVAFSNNNDVCSLQSSLWLVWEKTIPIVLSGVLLL